MSFVHPYLWFLVVLPLLLVFLYIRANRKTRKDLLRFAEKEVLPRIIDFSGARIRARQRILRIMAILFLVAALTGPGWGYRWQDIKNRGLQVIFALDTSNSMLAQDVKPNRLERSKLAIMDFLKNIEGGKAGLVAFAGSGFLQCPLTADFNAFSAALTALGTQSIPRSGTAIGAAINTGRKAFQSGEAGTKVLILITDGENHEGNPVNDAKEAAKDGITIYTIGIGSPEGNTIPITDSNGNTSYLKDNQGNTVVTKLNEEALREIAAAGKGAYFRGSGVSIGLEELYRTKLAKRDETVSGENWQRKMINRYQWPLSAAILMLIVELTSGLLRFKTGRVKEDRKGKRSQEGEIVP